MAEDIYKRCNTADELHGWIKRHLGMNIPRKSVCANHQAPFEYLWNAYRDAGDQVVWAPRGGGKTTLGAIATLLDLLHKPTCQVRILGGSLEQSLRMWEHLGPMLEQVAENEMDERGRSRRVHLKNGSAAAILTQSQRAVRGQRIQKLRCDEVELFDPQVWEAAQLVTRSRTREEAGGMQEENPGELCAIPAAIEALSTLHVPYGQMQKIITAAKEAGTPVLCWCLLDVLEKCRREEPCASCVLEEDCHGVAREKCEGFIRIADAIAMKKRVSRDVWEAEMLCLHPSHKNSVFDAFAVERHVGECNWWKVDDPMLQRTLAIDFGYVHPFVCLWILEDAAGRIFVMDEYQATRRTTSANLVAIAERGHKDFMVVACDPSGKQENRQTSSPDTALLKERGYRVLFNYSKVLKGVTQIRELLDPAVGPPRLRIHPRCRELIRSMECYHHSEKGGERPEKDNNNDHHIDALRYYLVTREQRHSATLRSGKY